MKKKERGRESESKDNVKLDEETIWLLALSIHLCNSQGQSHLCFILGLDQSWAL